MPSVYNSRDVYDPPEAKSAASQPRTYIMKMLRIVTVYKDKVEKGGWYEIDLMGVLLVFWFPFA